MYAIKSVEKITCFIEEGCHLGDSLTAYYKKGTSVSIGYEDEIYTIDDNWSPK